ncbi:disease resistance protein (TIR-NBS-LRR class) [Trifolium repens]|nr:disease resistance protein (TIR-NBS-LRR class) [Trifolium repens]
MPTNAYFAKQYTRFTKGSTISCVYVQLYNSIEVQCLQSFQEILESAESFAHIYLTKTAIKNLPSSLKYLAGLLTMFLNLCSNLVSLSNSIAKLNLLSMLDCSGCRRLTKIPNNIGSLSSLTKLLLQESSIMNLP